MPLSTNKVSFTVQQSGSLLFDTSESALGKHPLNSHRDTSQFCPRSITTSPPLEEQSCNKTVERTANILPVRDVCRIRATLRSTNVVSILQLLKHSLLLKIATTSLNSQSSHATDACPIQTRLKTTQFSKTARQDEPTHTALSIRQLEKRAQPRQCTKAMSSRPNTDSPVNGIWTLIALLSAQEQRTLAHHTPPFVLLSIIGQFGARPCILHCAIVHS
jgi:hypothetical protein